MKKFISIAVITLILALTGFVYFRYYFVFGEGVKAGELNYLTHKGYIFKTYEGKLIQSGFQGQKAGTIQSYEFKFSVEDKAIADSLMRLTGKQVELHYQEYIAPLPWRGVSNMVVDKILSVR
ncbi:MAG: hypothetical protein II215_05805 [Paludibacteraceae bacterium]|nr:hypothetical protein [Paludibacteraceae bacterium]MED9995172.1 hypothetical protein [Paludibacteraceae bacterium]